MGEREIFNLTTRGPTQKSKKEERGKRREKKTHKNEFRLLHTLDT
jgi:hypothetical protein